MNLNENALNANVGHRLRTVRLSKNVKQADCARELGVSPAYLNLIEKGKRVTPFPLLWKALRFFQVDPEEFMAQLGEGRVDEARRVYEPVANKVIPHARLTACGHWLAALEAAPQARSVEALATALGANKRDFDARFELAQSHFAAQRFTAAMDELLEIIMRDKTWRDELARKNYVAILELMTKPAPAKAEAAAPKGALEIAGKSAAAPSDPVVDAYRRKLSMALF